MPIDGITLYFISNLDSQLFGISDEYLLEYYEKEINAILPNDSFQIGIGNINTFMELMEVDKAMQNAKDNEQNKSNEFMGQEGKKEKWEL